MLSGLLAENYFPNATNCFNRYTNFSYYQLDEFNYNWTKLIQMATTGNPSPTQVSLYYLSATMYATKFLQTGANGLWVCNGFAMNVYKWMNFKYT